MLKNFRNRFLTPALLLVASLATSVTASAQDYLRSFTVYNRSSLVIRQLYVAPSSSTRWGRDWLGSSVLKPNWWAKVNVEPGYYDVKLIDEGGRACIVNSVDFSHSDYISLNNVNLLACEFRTN